MLLSKTVKIVREKSKTLYKRKYSKNLTVLLVQMYAIIWWIVFALPVGIKHNDKPFNNDLEGIDPGTLKPKYL